MWAWMVERVEDRDEFERRMWDPPPGMKPSEQVLAREADDFSAFAAAFGVGKPATLGSG